MQGGGGCSPREKYAGMLRWIGPLLEMKSKVIGIAKKDIASIFRPILAYPYFLGVSPPLGRLELGRMTSYLTSDCYIKGDTGIKKKV